MGNPVFSHVDTCGKCKEEKEVAVTPSGAKRCRDCYLGYDPG